nr:DUF359 domain-containing protein [Patescibacteria group bacterium]
YSQKSQSEMIEDYAVREATLQAYLQNNHLSDRAVIVPLLSPQGSLLSDASIEAVIVSPATAKITQEIQKQRLLQGLPSIEIIIVPHVLADDGQLVSSERIRKGEIDREGRSYLKFFLSKIEYQLPDNIRPQLQQPIGYITTNEGDITRQLASPLITIGDIVSLTLKKAGLTPSLAVIDNKTHRQPLLTDDVEKYFPQIDYQLNNPAGTINPEFGQIFTQALQKIQPQTILIDGEEDLLALPAMLLSPLGAVVVYGQFELGMVIVTITEEIKQHAKSLLMQFA